MEKAIYIFIGFVVGGLIGWCIKPDSDEVDKEAIRQAICDLNKGSSALKAEVDKHKL